MARAPSPRLDHLDALRALLVLYVVCVHALGYSGLAPGAARSAIDLIVSPVAVQGFYLVDGVLLARRLEQPPLDGARYLRDSARRLLWPWLLFLLAYTIARYLAERRGLVEATALTQAPPSLAGVAAMLWWSEAAPHLYFLPSLFLIRCAAVGGQRLLAAPAAAIVGAGLALLLAFRAVVEPAYGRLLPHDGLDPLLHALGGLGFFVLGAGLWRLRVNGRGPCAAGVAAAVAIAAIGFYLPGPLRTVAFQSEYAAALFFLFASGLFATAGLAAIGRRTMGIYLLHMPIVMKLCTLAASRLVDPGGIAAFALVVVASFAAALAITLVIERVGLGGLVLGQRVRATRPVPDAARGDQAGDLGLGR